MPTFALVIPGPVPTTAVASPGELEAITSQLTLPTTLGWVYYSATAPDVVTYPELKRFAWRNTGSTPHDTRWWNETTASWQVDVPAAGSITGSMLADNTVTMAKLYAPSSNRRNVMRIAAGSDAFELCPPANIFNDSELPIATLERPAAGFQWLLSSSGTANGWIKSTDFIASVAIDPLQLQAATTSADMRIIGFPAGDVDPTLEPVVNYIPDQGIDIDKISPAGGSAGQMQAVNSAGTAMEWVARPRGATTYVGTASIPASGSIGDVFAITATNNVRPQIVQFELVCTGAEYGYAVGDRLQHASVNGADSSEEAGLMVFYNNAAGKYQVVGPDFLQAQNAASAVVETLDRTKWSLAYTAIVFA